MGRGGGAKVHMTKIYGSGGGGGAKVHMTKMAAMPIYGKTLKNLPL